MAHKEYMREYYKTHPEYREASKKRASEWNRVNNKRRCEIQKKNRETEKSKEYFKVYMREYKRMKRKTDLNFRIGANLRRRLYSAMKRKKKTKTVKYLGCTIEQLRFWLEEQFQSGMTWDNYGSEWEIDHIYPISKHKLNNYASILEAFNWTNLQPLLISENRKKSNKIQ